MLHDLEAGFDPPPERAEGDYQKIGEFFYVFSLLEHWVDTYLKEHAPCGDFLEFSFALKIEVWRMAAQATEPRARPTHELYSLLKRVSNGRNAIAHARWHEDLSRGQLHGTDPKRQGKKGIGSHDLSEMLHSARRCQVIMEFWT